MTVATTPLVAWAAAAVAGGWLGWAWHPSRAVLVVGAAMALLVARCARGAGGRTIAGAAAVLLAVVLLTGLHLDRLSRGPLVDLATSGGTRDLAGVVVTDPRPSETGWWTLVRIERVGQRKERQRALWRGSGEPPPLGAQVRMPSSARPLGDTGFDAWLQIRHVAARIDAPSWELVEPPGWFEASTNWVRGRVRRIAARHLDEGPAGLAVGLVTGDVALLPAPDADNMHATGLSHLTAVSGSNVAIVLAGALVATRLAGARGPLRRALLLAVMAWFAVLTRLEPSVLRASVMAAVVLLAQARGRRTEPVHALAAATLLLVLVDPLLARSLGLLLSVSATAGLLIVAPLVMRRLTRLPSTLQALVATSIGAQVAVSPVLLLTTDEVPLVSVLANVIAVPAAAVASTLALLGATIGLALPAVGAAFLWAAAPPLRLVLGTAEALVGRGPAISLGASAVALGAGIVWLVAAPGSPAARRWGRATTVMLVALLAPVGWWPGPAVTSLTVTAIDVGQGDAILVQVPGRAVLIDGGDGDAAAAWLERHGPGRLDLVVLTHPHADHVGGLPDIVASHDVGAIWWRPLPEMTPSANVLADRARQRGIPMHEPRSGDRAALGDLVIDVLGPPAGRPYRWADSEPNEMSIVLRMSWRERTVLLTGDVEETGQEDLLERPQLLAADVLKVPHHGAGTTLPEFLAAVGAPTALVSLGADNDYGHPHPDTMAALASIGSTVRRTDQEGTIRVVLPVRAPALATALTTPPRRPLLTGFLDSSRVHSPGCRRRPPVGGSRARGDSPRVARRRQGTHRHRARGRRTRASPRAAHTVALR